MNGPILWSALGLCAAWAAARWLKVRGLARLDAVDKQRLVDHFSGQSFRKYAMATPVLLAYAFVFRPSIPIWVTWIPIALYLLGVLIYEVAAMRRLGIARSYIRAWAGGRVLQLSAVIGCLFGWMGSPR